MKIAISTIIDYNNYGNRLQNFASQEVLKLLGYEVETLPQIANYNIRGKIFNRGLSCLVSLNEKIPLINNEKFNQYLREKKFKKFTKKYISMYKEAVCSYHDLGKLSNRYDYIITGSDQVWNYNFRYNLDIDFLQFIESSKRIAYAPSFGISSIPQEYMNKYIHYLNGMKCLSVREHAGQKIIKDLTGREAEVLVDPTMMLTKEEWLNIATKPKCTPNKKFLLTYVLGNQTEDFNLFIEKLAKEKDLDVLNLLDPNDKYIHCVDPGEFIYLINNADVMVTDSFHGAVFSILMQTPFVIFERQDSNISMNSRIETLVSTFNMGSRLSRNINSVDDIFNITFEHVDDILEYERNKAIQYLKRAFEIEK